MRWMLCLILLSSLPRLGAQVSSPISGPQATRRASKAWVLDLNAAGVNRSSSITRGALPRCRRRLSGRLQVGSIWLDTRLSSLVLFVAVGGCCKWKLGGTPFAVRWTNVGIGRSPVPCLILVTNRTQELGSRLWWGIRFLTRPLCCRWHGSAHCLSVILWTARMLSQVTEHTSSMGPTMSRTLNLYDEQWEHLQHRHARGAKQLIRSPICCSFRQC